MSKDELPLLQGTLDLLVLRTVAEGPRHGYAVAQAIKHVTGSALVVEDRALYLALHRMEDRAWLESEWGLTERNRRAKFYRLTPEGRRQLAKETASFSRYVEAVFKVLRQGEA